ncbi:unnamed protein product [Linum tenue]|uniref:FBD domain-containing protein n=1 Tax=Linum tenue TaxID=586396 RepID=A0AAV0P6X2_9ROSI|nr:unnamed protein product [Linum tenue]
MVSNLDFNNRLTYKDLIGSGDVDNSLPEETEERKAVRFFGFVERVLRQHSNLDSLGRFRFHLTASEGNCKVMQGCLDKMELVFGSQIEAIEWWVWDATRFRNLPSIWRLPESFYTLKNLKDVNLHHVIMGADGPVSLPSLKNLNLWKAKFTDFDSLSRLISGCPVLETLCLEYCAVVVANENDFLIASMPSLRNLRIVGLGNDGYEDLCPIAMEAPMLTDLYLEDFSELQFLGSSSPLTCLCSARVDTNEGGGSYDSLIRLLTQISNVKEMCLDRKTLEFLSAGNDVQRLVFPNLTHLTIQPTEWCSSRVLHSLLHSASKLQSLVINVWFAYGPMRWEETEPTGTQQCLQSSLEEIEINAFDPLEGDVKMVGYLLNAGAVLKKLHVNLFSDPTKEECKELRSLLKLPRESSTCKVRITLVGEENDIKLDDDGINLR